MDILSLKDEIAYKLLKLIEAEPHLSQRDIAQKMGISLGKTNYCLKALINKGFIKFQNFYNNKKKTAYIYLLTPQGIEEKAQVTYRFLQRKIKEFEDIKVEIESLKNEAALAKETGVNDSDI
jgi:EPS-associated MarR family transcriptional regulator